MSNAIRLTPEAAAVAQARALDGWRRQGTVRTHRLGAQREVAGIDGHKQGSPKQPRQGTNGVLAGKDDRASETPPRPVKAVQRSKYGAVKHVDSQGLKFDSKLEAGCYRELEIRQWLGEIKNLRRQIKFSLFMSGGEHYGIYTADFVWDERESHSVMSDLLEWHRKVGDAKSPHTRKLPAWQKVKLLMKNCHGVDVLELP